MGAESNVGARLFLIGKDGALAGLNEITAATARLNAEIAKGGTASKAAAAGSAAQMTGLRSLGVEMDAYQTNLLRVNAETAAVAKVGKAAFFTLAAAGAVWGYESIKWAQNYQTQLVRLRTQAGLTVTAMNAIGRAAMNNAAALGTTPTAYLQAAYHPASAGMNTATTIQITNYAAKEAAISGAPLEDTANSITGVMKSYGFGAGQTGSTTAKLNAIVGAGNMRFADLNAALASGVAASANTFGVGLTSLGGALAFMTDRGVPAAQAGTHLRMALALLGAPSGEATKLLTAAGMASTTAASSTSAMSQMLQQAGVSTTQLSTALRDNSGQGGIFNALALLKKQLTQGGLSPEMQAAMISRSFGGGRMGTTIEMMYNNVGGLGAKSTQIDKNSTNKKFTQDWNAETKTLDFSLKQLGGTIHTLGTSMGTALIPPLVIGLKLFTGILGVIGQNKVAAGGLALVITALLVPAIGVYLKRSLLSAGGSINTVIAGYKRLLSSQTEEQVALARTDIALNSTTAATERLAVADGALTGASTTAAAGAARGGAGGLLGAGGGLGGKLLGGLGLAVGGWMVGDMIQHGNGSTITNGHSKLQNLESLGGDMAKGAGIGALLGNVIPIPGVGAGLGAVVGATGGAIYADRHQIGHQLTRGWDDLFGGGSSSNNPKPLQVRVDNHVYLDGKEVTKAVTKTTKATTART